MFSEIVGVSFTACNYLCKWLLTIIQKLGCGFLFAFHSTYGSICSHFGDIQHQRMA